MNNPGMKQPGIRRSLFWRLWLRSLTVKRPQAALAVASVVVGAAVASLLLNLYGDAQRKMTQEFRAYGPNVVVAPSADVSGAKTGVAEPAPGLLDEDVMDRLAPFGRRLRGFEAVPVLYAVGRVGKIPAGGSPSPRERLEEAVAVGADFPALQRINPSWQIDGSPESVKEGSCAVGAHMAARLALGRGDPVGLRFGSPANSDENLPPTVFRVAAIVTTGTSEDDQLFVPLESLQQLGGLKGKLSWVELSVPGEGAEIERTFGELKQSLQTFPGVEVRPLRQLVYSVGRILYTVRGVMLWLTSLILVIIALCVMATMTAIVVERRKDVAVMKSLGASDRLLKELFMTEGATLGLAGGAVGFALGLVLAHVMARRLFQVNLSFVGWTLPVICVSSMMLAGLATLLPMEIVRGIQPARVLRGE